MRPSLCLPGIFTSCGINGVLRHPVHRPSVARPATVLPADPARDPRCGPPTPPPSWGGDRRPELAAQELLPFRRAPSSTVNAPNEGGIPSPLKPVFVSLLKL